MKLLRTVIIKEILTEQKKNELIKEFELEIEQSERELEQLTFQLYKTTKDLKNKHEQNAIRNRYTEELNKRKERLQTITFKVQQLHKLEIGTEIQIDTAERIIDVNIGDTWIGKDEQAEIVIKDGLIHEIREGRHLDE